MAASCQAKIVVLHPFSFQGWLCYVFQVIQRGGIILATVYHSDIRGLDTA